MREHTPTPWRADGTLIYADHGMQLHVADCTDLTNKAEDNAAFIVEAVNAQSSSTSRIEALEAALTKVQQALTKDSLTDSERVSSAKQLVAAALSRKDQPHDR